MLLTIIVYIYTVIAFNFFRKFYVQEEDEEVDKKCHDMLTVSSVSFYCRIYFLKMLYLFYECTYFLVV
jgi:hypothetical protein